MGGKESVGFWAHIILNPPLLLLNLKKAPRRSADQYLSYSSTPISTSNLNSTNIISSNTVFFFDQPSNQDIRILCVCIFFIHTAFPPFSFYKEKYSSFLLLSNTSKLPFSIQYRVSHNFSKYSC